MLVLKSKRRVKLSALEKAAKPGDISFCFY